jgi:hypothetical protein
MLHGNAQRSIDRVPQTSVVARPMHCGTPLLQLQQPCNSTPASHDETLRVASGPVSGFRIAGCAARQKKIFGRSSNSRRFRLVCAALGVATSTAKGERGLGTGSLTPRSILRMRIRRRRSPEWGKRSWLLLLPASF